MTKTTDIGWFYNLQVNRSRRTVRRELRAILKDKPAFLALNEAMGYRLPRIRGYVLAHDRSTRSRANVALYVRGDLPLSQVRYIDLEETWGRTQHPGDHEARSYLQCRVAGIQVTVYHAAPRYTDNTMDAQAEGIRSLTKTAASWRRNDWMNRGALARVDSLERPRIVIGDFNRGKNDVGPGPTVLAKAIGGEVATFRIDTAVTRNVEVKDFWYYDTVHGVPLKSDHKHALRLTFAVESRWL